MRPTKTLSRLKHAGFSLVELMVGMAIGLLAVIVIIQVISLFDAQSRTTIGTADAQTNGGIALYTIARELQMAGYPLLPVDNSSLECTTVNVNAGATGITGLTPVSVANGTASTGIAASDSITIRYGTSQMGGAITQSTGSVVGTAVTVLSNLGCAANDISLISNGGTCNLSKVTAVSAPAVTPITVTLTDATGGAVNNANVACLGTWTEVTYAVNQTTGNLDRTQVLNGVSTTTPSVVGVVNLQAQYGISATTNSNQVTQWVDASGATWGAPTVANRNRIKAIRIAVVARNDKMEPGVVSSACSSTTTAAPTGLCAWEGNTTSPAPAIDLSPANANWARYRYRVFETIIPLRNVIWAKDTL
jgi:type IV pilus assembly protein PilW